MGYPNRLAMFVEAECNGVKHYIETLKRYDIPLTAFEKWAYKHRNNIVID
jgi:hypothetical protein